MSEVGALVERHSLVTVVGVGGIGKTRIIAEMLAGSGAHRKTSAHFVDVTTAGKDDGVLIAVLDAFGVVHTTATNRRRQLHRLLSSTSRLIVLDNAETRLDDVRRLVRDLLAIDGTRVVVTSRVPLSIAGEQLFQVPPLSATDATQLLSERIADTTRQQPGQLVDAMLEHVDGLPLAIELLAARCVELGFAEINLRLGQLPNLLARPGTERQGSLRSVLDASYDAVDDDARKLLRLCSPMLGGFSRELAHHVFGDPFGDAARLDQALDRLVQASLVSFSRQRLRLLEPVRQYAEERLDASGDRDESDHRLIAWCGRLARDAFDGYPAHPRLWRPRLFPESANIEVAIRAALRTGNVAAALRACGGFAHYWLAERPGAGLALVSEVHGHIDGSENDIDRAWGNLARGCLGQVAGEVDTARRHLENAARSFEQHRERSGLTAATYWLALLNPTEEIADRVVALATETDNPYLVGWAYVDYAYDLLYTWEPAPGQSFDDIASEVGRTLDIVDPLVTAHGLEALRLGVIDARVKLRLLQQGGVRVAADDEALAALAQESEQLARRLGSPWYVLGAMCLVGMVSFHRGRLLECGSATEELLEVAERQDSPLLDDQNVTTKGILLTACLLHERGEIDVSREIVASIAPNIARHPPAWVDYNAPVAALAECARQNQTGEPLTVDQLYAIAARCRDLLQGSVLSNQ